MNWLRLIFWTFLFFWAFSDDKISPRHQISISNQQKDDSHSLKYYEGKKSEVRKQKQNEIKLLKDFPPTTILKVNNWLGSKKIFTLKFLCLFELLLLIPVFETKTFSSLFFIQGFLQVWCGESHFLFLVKWTKKKRTIQEKNKD